MRIGLGRKLFLATGGIVVLLLLATFAVLERNQAQAWEDHLFSQSLSFARLATPELLKRFRGSFPPDEPAEISNMHEFLALNRELAQFSLISVTGRRLYLSQTFPSYAQLQLQPFNDEDLNARLSAERTVMITRHLPDGRRLLDLIEPAFGPTGQRIVSVRYLISYDAVDARLSEARRVFLSIALIAVCACLLMVSLVARRITRPVEKLTDGARTLAQGDLSVQIETADGDEIGALAKAFNDMAQSLALSRDQLTGKNQDLSQANYEISQANQEMQMMQQQLLRSERLAAIGQLAAGVSHEIDNPVGIILGHAELLLEDLAEGDPRRDDVRAIIEECRRCKRITGGLLGFARSSEGVHEQIDFTALIEEALLSLKPQKLFKFISLETSFPQQEIAVVGDADQLRQILINLMLNAAQALGGEGVLSLKLTAEEERAILTVEDNGPGIAVEDRENIFQPFFSTKPPGEGTGLGLPLCRKIIEAHGGEISATESNLGGALMRVVLPMA